jgi:S-adenosylmethionine/arginine decarboxylase-like enzyme
MTYWGYHFLLDCAECENISDPVHIKNFVSRLCEKIKMTPVGEPIIELLLLGDDNQGYSLMQLISTSNITAHFVDKNKTAYIDVFSCKPFAIVDVKSVVSEYFNPKHVNETFIKRQA